jgi:hypothetical protein
MKGKLSSGRVEPVVRPPFTATCRSRLSDLVETARVETGDLDFHSTEEAAHSGLALKHRRRLTT